jgi:hypothetical protein
MTSPAVARRCSHSRDRDLSIVALRCGWLRFPFGSAASRDVMGQGLRRGQRASARHLPSRSLARELRPNPFGSDTSCRRSRRAQAGVACVAEASFRSLLARACLASIRLLRARSPPPGPRPASLRSRFRSETGPPHTHPREGERDPLHPRCLPSSDSPCRGSPRPPQAVPSLWSGDAGAFFVPRAARAFDEASGSARTRSCAERDRLQEPGTPPLRPQRLQTTSTFGSIRG